MKFCGRDSIISKILFCLVSFMGSVGFAEHKLACRYYDKTKQSQETSLFHPGLPWLWARGEQNEYIGLEGNKTNGFLEVFKLKGKTPYSVEPKIAMEFCQNALKKAFPKDYQNKVVLDLISKSSYLSFSFKPLVFPKNNGRFDRMVIFGDSLSDQGNLRNWLRIFPADPYFAGRFTNGPNWVDYWQKNMNLAVQNNAYGGAVAHPHQDPEFNRHKFSERALLSASLAICGNMETEVQKYITNTMTEQSAAPNSSTLFVIWIGGNDYLTWLGSSKDADIFIDQPNHERAGSNTIVNSVTTTVKKQLKKLYDAGARNFLVMNLPNLGITPRLLETETYHLTKNEPAHKRLISLSQGLTRISRVHNHLLNEKIQDFMRENAGVTLNLFDTYNVLDTSWNILEKNAIKHSPNYGIDSELVNTISYDNQTSTLYRSCYNKAAKSPLSLVCKEPQQKLFWDDIHPTSYIHCLMALSLHSTLSEQGLLEQPNIRGYIQQCRPDLL